MTRIIGLRAPRWGGSFARTLFLLVGLVVAGRADATVTQTFCVTYLTSYTDGASGDYLTGSSYHARGSTLRLVRNSNGDVYDFTLDDTGCLAINLNAEPWTVKSRLTATVLGNTVNVKEDLTSALYVATLDNAFTPTNGTTKSYSFGTGSGAPLPDVVNIMAAGLYAISNRNGGFSGQTFSFRDGHSRCPEDKGCYHLEDQTINITSGSASSLSNYKFGITHELGHAMADATNAFQGGSEDCEAVNDSVCTAGTLRKSHQMGSKEYNSCAAWEGFGHFYSALVFNNDGTGQDCWIQKHYIPDWNSDGSPGTGEVETFSCEVGVASAVPDPVPPNDFLGTYDGGVCIASGSVSHNRGTEYDWLRMFWDLHTDHAITFPQILELWNFADADDWNADGDGYGTSYPAGRMSDAADYLNFQSDYDAAAAWNGTDR